MRRRSGYTLIEVLVVIVILSIASGLVVVNLGRDRGALLEEDARRLALVLQFARDQAITRGQPFAWTADASGYKFSRRQRGRGWVQVDAAEGLAARAWPEHLRLTRLRISGLVVPPGEPLIFTASGFNQPYDLVLASGPWQVVLAGDLAGRVRFERARLEPAGQP